MTAPDDLLKTPLHDLHLELGARLVPFAGYRMPVSYPAGIAAEHRHCRQAAALFDVSHMGQLTLSGAGADAALESLVPMDVIDLPVGKQRYALFTDANGGILDDLMITRREHDLFLVVNASRKDADVAHLRSHVGAQCTVRPLPERALLALQGPAAAEVLSALDPAVADLTFMTGATVVLDGVECFVTRSGYTGEDGFEISVPGERAEALARRLLSLPLVAPAGLGARDTLRLEAGLCLYGQDIDETTSPVEAGLTWAIQKVRRPGGARAGGFPGAAAIAEQLARGAPRKRVGLTGLERTPVRPGAAVFDAEGAVLGLVTSGTLAPTVDKPVAMAYLRGDAAVVGQPVFAEVRGKRHPMQVCAMPFVAHRYHRTPA